MQLARCEFTNLVLMLDRQRGEVMALLSIKLARDAPYEFGMFFANVTSRVNPDLTCALSFRHFTCLKLWRFPRPSISAYPADGPVVGARA